METLDALTETLDTELKGWLILSEPREAALFAKACLALRNNDGGRLVLGIDDTTMKSIPPRPGFDPVQAYHVDKINEVVGKYSLPKFEVRIGFKEYEQRVHPEIIIPGGIQAPVITRSGFAPELRQNAVYVRTISNGRPSSCEPMTTADWEKLMRICFDNREADIGRFMRRHLPKILVQMGIDMEAVSKQSDVHPEQAALDLLQKGWERLNSRWTEKFESPHA
jgi:hypothetical protein